MKSKFIVWIAQGFGIGRIPYAPGTWGSVLGVGWSMLLFTFVPLGTVVVTVSLSALLAIWICGEAEKILGKKDPGSIVLDEIVAMPLVYLGLGLYVVWGGSDWREFFLSSDRTLTLTEVAEAWPIILAGFLLFRLFDIWKPWPVGSLQNLRGGWGVVMDDLAAAVLASAVLLIATFVVAYLLLRIGFISVIT